MTRPTLAALAFATFVATATAGFADGLTARISSNAIALGDTFQLTLSADPSTLTAAPDISPLNGDFDILGTSKSSQTRIVNGVRSDTVEWIVTLAPRATGHFTIPPLSAGAETSEALDVDVRQTADLPQGNGAQGADMTLTAAPGHHYVQQEIPLTLRITAPAGLRDGAITEPESPDYILERRGEDRVSRMTRGGQPVTVIERDYLLRPQTGGALTVAPFTLRGAVDDPSARSPFPADPFRDFFGGGASPFERMFNPGRPVALRSAPLTLEIAARPGEAADWFLPAKAVELSASWEPENPTFRVGEAVVRHVRIKALGASDVQLPDIETPQVTGARIYRDRAQSGSVDTPQGTAAVRDFSFSVVPTTGGALTLPEITVNWFDTEAEQPRVATLPAETITVEGTAAAAPSEPAGTLARPKAHEAGTAPQQGRAAYYAMVAAFAALAAIAAGLLRPVRKPGGKSGAAAQPTQGAARRTALRQLEAACKASDRTAAYAGALAWLRAAAEHPKGEPEMVLRRFPELGKRWAELEAREYASAPEAAWDANGFLRAFRTADRQLENARLRRRAAILPPLYGRHKAAS